MQGPWYPDAPLDVQLVDYGWRRSYETPLGFKMQQNELQCFECKPLTMSKIGCVRPAPVVKGIGCMFENLAENRDILTGRKAASAADQSRWMVAETMSSFYGLQESKVSPVNYLESLREWSVGTDKGPRGR